MRPEAEITVFGQAIHQTGVRTALLALTFAAHPMAVSGFQLQAPAAHSRPPLNCHIALTVQDSAAVQENK